MEFLGKNMRRIREALNLSQKQLGERAGISQQHVYKLESGAFKNPGLDVAVKVARGLGITLGELLAVAKETDSAGNFRNNLKRLRVGAGLSQAELAKKSGFSTQQIMQLETGRSAASVEAVMKFAEALEVSPDEFLIDVPEMAKSARGRPTSLSEQGVEGAAEALGERMTMALQAGLQQLAEAERIRDVGRVIEAAKAAFAKELKKQWRE